MFDKLILEPFVKTIRKFQDRNAFCINETFYTYNQFGFAVTKIQEALRLLPESEPHIGLVVNDDLETYASIFALWLEGKAYIPIHPQQPAERNAEIIKQVKIITILNSSNNNPVDIDNNQFKIIKTSELSVNASVPNIIKKTNDDNYAYILFTSGSTGKPKGVPISRKNLAGFVNAFQELNIDINENDRCLQMFELTFDLSVMSYLIPLLKGACIYTIPQDQIKFSYIDLLMEEHKLTFSLMVPSILNYLRPYFKEIKYPDLKYSLFCGEALHEDITKEWSNVVPNAKISNVYGPTENTIFCTSYLFNRKGENKSYNGILSIGKEMYNTKVIITDEKNNILPFNTKGELCLSGIQLTPGYWNNKEKNDEVFFYANIDGKKVRFYKTGDICVMDKNKDILYIGRSDSQTQIQGFRVELSEIEFYIKRYLPDRNVVVITYSNQMHNTELGVCIEGKEIEEDKLFKFLKTKLPSYMIPGKIKFINKFPLNMSGKTDKNRLKEIMITE